MDNSGAQTCLNIKTCLLQYKTIGSEHMHVDLFDTTIFGRVSGEHVPTILIPMCLLSGSHNCVPDTHVWLH